MRVISARSRRALLGWVTLAAALLAVAMAWPNLARAQTPAEELVEQVDVEVGAELYALHCAACHGASGQGGTIGGRDVPAITDVSLAYMDLVMRVGRMPPPEGNPFDNRARTPILTDEQRLTLLAYTVRAFGINGAIPELPEGDPASGQALYAANCAACHGATGQGGVAGGGAWTPAIVGYEEVVIAEAVRVGPFEMPAFSAEQINDQGLADIAAFLDLVQEEEGTLLGLIELNPVYVSGFVAIMAVVLIFALLYISGTPTWFPDPQRPDDQAGDGA